MLQKLESRKFVLSSDSSQNPDQRLALTATKPSVVGKTFFRFQSRRERIGQENLFEIIPPILNENGHTTGLSSLNRGRLHGALDRKDRFL
jgi:hypothetical protein